MKYDKLKPVKTFYMIVRLKRQIVSNFFGVNGGCFQVGKVPEGFHV